MNTSFEERLRRAETVLTRVADGDFDVRIESDQFSEDALGSLEMGINFLIVDLRSVADENARKTAALELQRQELEEKLSTIGTQAAAIQRLSAPVIEVWDDILALPLVGTLDHQRADEVMTTLLAKIVKSQARAVIVDLTGVDLIDSSTAESLLRLGRAVELLGTHCVLSGVTPAVAQTLVALGIDLGSMTTLRTLKDGLQHCMQHLDDPSLDGRR